MYLNKLIDIKTIALILSKFQPNAHYYNGGETQTKQFLPTKKYNLY